MRAGLDSGGAEQRGRLQAGHGEVAGADLDDAALRAEPGHRQQPRIPRCDGELRSSREGERQLRDRVDALAIRDRLRFVEDQRDGPAHRRDRGRQQRDDSDRRAGEGQRSQHHGRDRLDAVQGYRKVGQQDGRIVVAVVERRPRRPAVASSRPTGPAGSSCRSRPARRPRPLQGCRRSSVCPPARTGPRSPVGLPADAASTPTARRWTGAHSDGRRWRRRSCASMHRAPTSRNIPALCLHRVSMMTGVTDASRASTHRRPPAREEGRHPLWMMPSATRDPSVMVGPPRQMEQTIVSISTPPFLPIADDRSQPSVVK